MNTDASLNISLATMAQDKHIHSYFGKIQILFHYIYHLCIVYLTFIFVSWNHQLNGRKHPFHIAAHTYKECLRLSEKI